jgi:hypothetical protein
MVSIAIFRQLALSFPETVEQPHFEITSFRVNKKVFATLDETKQLVCVGLSPVQQSVFCAYDKTIIYPVPNKWGAKGATYIELKKVSKSMLKDALTQSYCKAAPQKLISQLKPYKS